MPLLANWIATLLGALIDWIVSYLGKRVGTAVTLFGFAATAGVTFWASTNALITALIPSTCVSAIIGTEFACGIYRWAKTVALASAVN